MMLRTRKLERRLARLEARLARIEAVEEEQRPKATVVKLPVKAKAKRRHNLEAD
jgi:hypothetical protein